jgi:hypothetical protein
MKLVVVQNGIRGVNRRVLAGGGENRRVDD